MSSVPLTVVAVARLDDHKLLSKLAPLLDDPRVGTVHLVRRTPLAHPRIVSHCPPEAWRGVSALAEPWRLQRVLRLARAGPRGRTLAISFYFFPHALYAEAARRVCGVPTVPLLLSQMDVDMALSRPAWRGVLTGAHAVGVRGETSVARLLSAGLDPQRIFAPPNVFDPRPFAPDPAVAKDVDVLYVGALVSVKRLDRLLEAARLLKQRQPGLRVVLLGEGPERESLLRHVRLLGLSDTVELAGAASPESVPGWLRRARAFVMTSEAEGLPMAMVEAMSAGLPVVVPDVGDVTTVARDGENALVVRDPTPDAFADALSRALTDDTVRARLAAGALAAAQRFQEQYSMAAARAAWDPVLLRLASAAPR